MGGGSKWKDIPNGIYAVASNGSPVSPEDADNTCIAIAIIFEDHKFMIEKNEYDNEAYKIAAQQLGSKNTDAFSWGGYNTDQPDIPTYNQVGGGRTGDYGFLVGDTMPALDTDPNNWTGSNALGDWNGKTNCEIIKNITTNGSSTSKNSPMGILINIFNSDEKANCGYTDWYIPSCGQLALMGINLMNINNILRLISGKELHPGGCYWSSSEYDQKKGWCICNNTYWVGTEVKNALRFVRLIRDIK